MKYNILLAGDGGQGIQTIGDILAKAMIQNGHNVTLIPNYGLEQRGGVSLVFIKVSDEEIVYPKFSFADILLVLSEQAEERTIMYRGENTEVIKKEEYEKEMKEKDVGIKNENVFFLKVLTEKLEHLNLLRESDVFQYLQEKLSKKIGWEENEKVFSNK
ncbi:MAG: 2-oxoacid:acceptor oxidoreductase family protein [Candidatus Magasanikbacteria bacterium]